MSKLFYEAMRCLPVQFVDEATRHCEYESVNHYKHTESIIVLNLSTEEVAMIYTSKTRKWQILKPVECVPRTWFNFWKTIKNPDRSRG